MARYAPLCLLSALTPGALQAQDAAQSPPPRRIVAITIDDLPYAGSGSVAEAGRVTDSILAALGRHDAPATAFVTGRSVFQAGEVTARLDLLRRWARAGARLENHSYSHRSFNRTPLWMYQDDAIKGELAPALVMDEMGKQVRFFRHPYNHTGPTEEMKAQFEAFMELRDYRIAPFTVEHADYAFNQVYMAARESGNQRLQDRVSDAYLEQLDSAFVFAERLAEETFGRPIAHIFLIHANDINADHLGRMLERLSARGYTFVDLAEAMEDDAYQTPEEYVGINGVSWLHRWRKTLGMESRLRQEPDPPRWLIDAAR